MDIVDLSEFYATRLGAATRRALSARLKPMFSGLTGAKVVGLGYAVPYLGDGVPEAEALFAFMLARQGVFAWPEGAAVRAALVDECELPLLESAVDAALVVHGLEFTDSPEDMLKEVWRVLAPQGRLILVVPNRRGVWARFDASPFGHGRPFSRPQITALLREGRFSISTWSNSLYFPPSTRAAVLSSAGLLETVGGRIAPAISGVLVVEAVKQVYAAATGKRVRRSLVRARPVLVPLPSRREPPSDP